MSSSGSQELNCERECGDTEINWNLTYMVSLMTTAESQLNSIANQLIAEVSKMRSDATFVQDNLCPPHKHLKRIDATIKDACKIIDEFRSLADKSRVLARKAAKRVVSCKIDCRS